MDSRRRLLFPGAFVLAFAVAAATGKAAPQLQHTDEPTVTTAIPAAAVRTSTTGRLAAAALSKLISNPNLPAALRETYTAIFELHALQNKHHGDLAAVYRELDRRYKAGDARAALEISMLYSNPDFSEHDDRQSLVWAKRAANSGSDAAVRFVMTIERKRLFRGDETAGGRWMHWARKGANQGVYELQLQVARTYTNARLGGSSHKKLAIPGLKPDPEKAAYWFKRAASSAPAHAVDKIADRFQNGEGVRQNIPEAIRLYKREGTVKSHFKQGYMDAAWLLATCPLVPQKQKTEALVLAHKAVAAAAADPQATRTWRAAALDTLAAAYAAAGDFNRAVATERQAIRLAKKDTPDPNIDYERHLDSFLQSKPWVMRNDCRD